MGLKSGSRDAGLDESDDDEGDDAADQSTDIDQSTEQTNPERSPEQETTSGSTAESTAETERAVHQETSSQRPTMDSIPYKLRREKVNEDREQVPFFLREGTIEAEDGLQDTLEDLLGEDVYKSDYREAAMIVAHRNPELVAEVLREWGYDLDST